MCAVATTGCVRNMSLDEISAMRPVRAAEMNHLDLLVGDWETRGHARFAGLEEVLEVTGTSSAAWADDERSHLVERSTTHIPGLKTLSGTMIWIWDPRANLFRIFRVDGYPATGVGTARFDKDNQTWTMAVDAKLPQMDAVAKGRIQIVDQNTLRWTWREWDSLGLVEIVDMKGVSRRKTPASPTTKETDDPTPASE